MSLFWAKKQRLLSHLFFGVLVLLANNKLFSITFEQMNDAQRKKAIELEAAALTSNIVRAATDEDKAAIIKTALSHPVTAPGITEALNPLKNANLDSKIAFFEIARISIQNPETITNPVVKKRLTEIQIGISNLAAEDEKARTATAGGGARRRSPSPTPGDAINWKTVLGVGAGATALIAAAAAWYNWYRPASPVATPTPEARPASPRGSPRVASPRPAAGAAEGLPEEAVAAAFARPAPGLGATARSLSASGRSASLSFSRTAQSAPARAGRMDGLETSVVLSESFLAGPGTARPVSPRRSPSTGRRSSSVPQLAAPGTDTDGEPADQALTPRRGALALRRPSPTPSSPPVIFAPDRPRPLSPRSGALVPVDTAEEGLPPADQSVREQAIRLMRSISNILQSELTSEEKTTNAKEAIETFLSNQATQATIVEELINECLNNKEHTVAFNTLDIIQRIASSLSDATKQAVEVIQRRLIRIGADQIRSKLGNESQYLSDQYICFQVGYYYLLHHGVFKNTILNVIAVYVVQRILQEKITTLNLNQVAEAWRIVDTCVNTGPNLTAIGNALGKGDEITQSMQFQAAIWATVGFLRVRMNRDTEDKYQEARRLAFAIFKAYLAASLTTTKASKGETKPAYLQKNIDSTISTAIDAEIAGENAAPWEFESSFYTKIQVSRTDEAADLGGEPVPNLEVKDSGLKPNGRYPNESDYSIRTFGEDESATWDLEARERFVIPASLETGAGEDSKKVIEKTVAAWLIKYGFANDATSIPDGLLDKHLRLANYLEKKGDDKFPARANAMGCVAYQWAENMERKHPLRISLAAAAYNALGSIEINNKLSPEQKEILEAAVVEAINKTLAQTIESEWVGELFDQNLFPILIEKLGQPKNSDQYTKRLKQDFFFHEGPKRKFGLQAGIRAFPTEANIFGSPAAPASAPTRPSSTGSRASSASRSRSASVSSQ